MPTSVCIVVVSLTLEAKLGSPSKNNAFREHDEQRRLKDDLRKVGPVVLLWIPPGIGYIAMLLVILAPRQALSRQFYSRYEKELYASIEYRQCKSHFRALSEHVFGSVMVNVHSLDIPVQGQDAAGPILDLVPYYSVFSNATVKSVDTRLLQAGKLAHLETYPREHLISLALANGLYQSYPDLLSRLFATCCPWLRGEVRRIANLVATDDKLLLEEAYDSNGCESMTDQEVLDACLMRGLPVTVSYAEMRLCLTNHLTMIKVLRESLPKQHATPEGLKLLTLHLSALRYYLREEVGL
jgi:hypothetical protein